MININPFKKEFNKNSQILGIMIKYLMSEKKLTPMLKQYFEIKKRHPDSILFFRMGDFYEMFFEDAKIAAPILDIVLTARNKNVKDSVPLCGLPYHARDNYASKLLKNGYKVAICEQVEDPSEAIGIVKRDVVRILTPATALEIDLLNNDLNNFIIAIFVDEKTISMASIDLSISEFEVSHFKKKNIEVFLNEFYRKFPKELIVPETSAVYLKGILGQFPEFTDVLVNEYKDYEFNFPENENLLKEHFGVDNLEGYGIEKYDTAIIASGVLLKYIKSLRKTALKNILSLKFVLNEEYMMLDSASFKNLEILKNLRTGNSKGSLFNAIDLTMSSMGKRLLKKWISYPLINKDDINDRLDGVEEFFSNLIVRAEVRKILRELGDLAKLNSKILLNIALPIHLLALKDILKRIPELKDMISPLRAAINKKNYDDLEPLSNLTELIEKSILPDPANTLSDGGFINTGYNKELDELRGISKNAKEIVSAMEDIEKRKTGIPSLKIKYNRVFGYFIEVTKTHLKLIPDEYIRKQTLVNSERFITGELKELEEKILKAEEKIIQIEKDLYLDIIKTIQSFSMELNKNSDCLAILDVISAGAELAQRNNYIRPEISEGREIDIKNGRHPVIEFSMSNDFIPNDTLINSKSDQILIITGPNMGGKSTYLRQNALIVILAQAGLFVPASEAKIGICDRIFTRIGASDSLIEGKSTFMVEMIETAIILNNASSRSLILLDEIGRGTSTFDGLSIAWSVIEYLNAHKGRPKTLFATHYHELVEIPEIFDGVKNYHIAVREWNEKVVFLHKIIEGATDQSFGIHVAKIAGLPLSVIERSKEVLLDLEKKETDRLVSDRISGKIDKMPKQQKLFKNENEIKVWDDIRNKLTELDITTMTPLEAMNILHYLKHKSEQAYKK